MDIMKNRKQSRLKAFTLAEALITLVIIGVIAALTIPAIFVNTEQHEYKSSLKKALAMINQVIEMNIALDGYGPIETSSMETPTASESLYEMFRNRMNVISTSTEYDKGGTSNYAFFTADGMRYEFPTDPEIPGNTEAKFATKNFHCATPGGDVQDDSGETASLPCLIIVDVNGERRPNPTKSGNGYKVPSPKGRSKVLDVFPIVVTDKNAYPFGVVAQRVMFQQ